MMKRLCVSSFLVLSLASGSISLGQATGPIMSSAPRINVSTDQLLHAGDHSDNWLTYSGSYSAQR